MLDARTRAPLWERGWDYRHGTGHGIGSFLNVHEGPASIGLGYQGPQVEALRAALDPGQHRSLRWDACPVLQDPGLCDNHVVVGGQSPERMDGIYYPLGRNSYLSESAYYMTPGTFGDRYWGEDNYRRLLGIKARYDPTGVFWCRHCVGDTEEQSV